MAEEHGADRCRAEGTAEPLGGGEDAGGAAGRVGGYGGQDEAAEGVGAAARAFLDGGSSP
ncbi:hypothetical protein ACIBVL_01405 [Streptomyces sp. NPDC049687]|uniref:hypothetical protein n=1 Tax=Streptomyces sp. NPDC049687 TaxID=3365596 RepID=UPI0037B85035